MSLLFTIPHFFPRRAREHGKSLPNQRYGSYVDSALRRAESLAQCIHALHQHYGRPQCMMQLAEHRTREANAGLSHDVHVVICTTGGEHVLNELDVDRRLYYHHSTHAEAMMLGFECQTVLRDRWGNYDYYGYLEDDLILHDPWLFLKLAWFNGHVGDNKLLLPNRFERGRHPLVIKAYIDGDLSPQKTAAFQNTEQEPRLTSTVMGVELTFDRPLNPHSGCYFLSAAQMAHWVRQPYFLDPDVSFIGPLESAATLGIMRAFQIYKPARVNAGFLEIEHYGDQFLSQLREDTESSTKNR